MEFIPADHVKNFQQPDETRNFKAHGHMEVVKLPDGWELGKAVFEPGWKWSQDVKSLVHTESCQVEHIGYCLAGTMVIRMDNGEELVISTGDAFQIPPGHDAWVEGHEQCTLLDFVGYREYANSKKVGNRVPVDLSGEKFMGASS